MLPLDRSFWSPGHCGTKEAHYAWASLLALATARVRSTATQFQSHQSYHKGFPSANHQRNGPPCACGLHRSPAFVTTSKLHPYSVNCSLEFANSLLLPQVPEVITVPIQAGSQPYLDWIKDSTISAGKQAFVLARSSTVPFQILLRRSRTTKSEVAVCSSVRAYVGSGTSTVAFGLRLAQCRELTFASSQCLHSLLRDNIKVHVATM